MHFYHDVEHRSELAAHHRKDENASRILFEYQVSMRRLIDNTAQPQRTTRREGKYEGEQNEIKLQTKTKQLKRGQV